MLQVISLLVENKPGALMRITGVLSARGYNIESLTVARTLDPTLSRMTIVVDVDPALRRQVIKQMNKLINVLQASDLTEEPAVAREMVLLRVRAPLETRTAILKEAEIFSARVVDSSVEGFVLEASGAPEKLDEFIDVMRAYGDIEVTRSGMVAVALEARRLRLSPPVPTRPERDNPAASRLSEIPSSLIPSWSDNGKPLLRTRRRFKLLERPDRGRHRLWQPRPRPRPQPARLRPPGGGGGKTRRPQLEQGGRGRLPGALGRGCR